MTVTIEDDGTGFDIGMLQQPKPGHFGFNSLRERATKIGASLQICSNASLGTTVTLRLPNSRASHESAN